jgi:hypothetical protein
MESNNIIAPYIDNLINSCQSYPEVKNEINIKRLADIFKMICCIEKQGDDEYRNIWISAERGKIDDFGNFNEYLENGEVSNLKEFEDLWHYYYPDKMKWYNFAISKYADVHYFYINSKLTFQFKLDDTKSDDCFDFQKKLTEWLLKKTEQTLVLIKNNVKSYNDFINSNLPYRKRTGRILRSDFWTIFPEFGQEFYNAFSPEIIEILNKVKVQSESKTFKYLTAINSGDFFRFCEIGYDANKYFDKSDKILTAREKYIAMADGRDCGLTMLNEQSNKDFSKWYETEKNCGGHPWEICRGGNSTHISLYICQDKNGWYLRLEGSSRARVIETIKIAIALYKKEIPFILGKAEEICRMASGVDYIGIVPENVTPRYCHSYFPAEDKIIDFMNLGTEKINEIIKKTFWYPLPEVHLIG